jgi:hypothetical protein
MLFSLCIIAENIVGSIPPSAAQMSTFFRAKKMTKIRFFINLSTQKFIWRNVKAAAERAVD